MHVMKRFEKRSKRERGLNLMWLEKTKRKASGLDRIILYRNRTHTGQFNESRRSDERRSAAEVLTQRSAGGAFAWWLGMTNEERAAVIEAARSKRP